ncbi:MAG: 2-oxoglutarate dehydrogenase E2 component (dihydrolipoamide succinyltransferase), partial [Cyclobacteriaceae bacterium]
TVEMIMPKMGESVMEGTILTWLKQVGDTIEEDESILEVATDKVDTEIPATNGGVLKQILANEGDVVQVGKPVAIIEINDEATEVAADDSPAPSIKSAVDTATSIMESAVVAHSSEAIMESIPVNSDSGRFYSPLVRNIAKEENIALSELENISGTGKEGRVTKSDILSYLDKKGGRQATATETTVLAGSNGTVGNSPTPMPVTISGEDEIIEMDRMRKMIAGRMVASKAISAHVTSFVEADVTGLVKWRNKWKNTFKEREGQSLTFTPIMIEAVVKAIKDYPMINIQVDGDRIIKKAAINIGMAVALPSGNLIVPVIKNADQLSLLGITKAVNDLAKRARDNKLKPDELSGGTFTISNVGSFGNVMGTPIIMQPQVGIMALGAIQKKPAVIETPEGDFIGIRHKMFLSHSYDHRVVDGALGGMLVRRVADYLERFDMNTSI